MENINPNNMEPIIQPVATETPPAPKPKRSLATKIILSLLVVLAAGVGYVGYTNPEIFRAALTELTGPAGVPAGQALLYIPNYGAGPTDSGSISVKIKSAVTNTVPNYDKKVYGVQFKLKWSPSNSMALNSDSIVFEPQAVTNPTLFASADLKNVDTSVPGEAIVSILTLNGVQVSSAAEATLFKLAINLNAVPGSTVTLEAPSADVQVIEEGAPPDEYITSTQLAAIDTGTIAIISQKNLRVLNAETLDSTHVLVRFSDLLSSIGAPTNYNLQGGLTSIPSAVVSGYQQGYDQKAVILTTSEQVPGREYTLQVTGTNVTGNTQGGVDAGVDDGNPAYDRVKFVGFGIPSLSTFSVTKAVATAVRTLELTFSDAVATGSVSSDSFKIALAENITQTVGVSNAVPAGNKVTLTTDADLLGTNTYIVTVDNTIPPTPDVIAPVRRASDNAVAGFNKIAFAGYQAVSGFGIVSAQTLDQATVMVTFSANLDQATVSNGQFTVFDSAGGPKTVLGAEIQTGFQKVKLTLNSNLGGGVCRVVVTKGSLGIRPYGLSQDLIPYAAVFMGYQPPIGLSAVKIESPIDVHSSTSVTLHLSGNLKAATVTPVNLKIEKFGTTTWEPLTVVYAALKVNDPKTIELVTGQQGEDVNYFVTFEGVQDSSGLPLGNARVLNFFGFKVPTIVISGITPNTVINDADKTVVVTGENLDTVETARFGTTEATIADKTSGALTLSTCRVVNTVVTCLAPGVYDLNLVSTTAKTVTLANALTVNAPDTPLRVISEDSRAIPARVAPDGKTDVTFWVLVEDPKDLNNISSVTIDLEQIGGNRAQEMTKDTGVQQQYRQFYKFTTKVATTTPTATEPLKLPVEVRKGTEVVKGTVELTVTRIVLKSVPPTIDQVYANPDSVPPDGEAKFKISAKVSDPDGAATITSVVADLGPIGGFVNMTSLNPAGLGQQLTGWFTSEELSVPKAAKEKDYTVTVTAEDETGASVSKPFTLTVSTAVNAPKFDTAKSYIGPRKSVPKDGKTPFAIHAMVSDPDGVGDIDSVTAYFGTSGLTPVALTRDPSATETSKSALYNSPDIVIPPTTPTGVQDIELVAVDKLGGKGNLVLQVDVTTKDTLGDPPFINNKKAYTSPKIAVNDGKTPVTLYAFIRDDDGDLESVVVNLIGVGQLGTETPPDLGEVGGIEVAPPMAGETCPTGSLTMVCMTPSFKEGKEGQWFVLSEVTISSSTGASPKPYLVEVIATDAAGHVTRGQIPVTVSETLKAAASRVAPEVVAAVPVGSSTLEVVFSKPMDPLSLGTGGANFTITESQDVSKKLTVLGATIDASGMTVTLTTDTQEAGKNYVLNASNKVTDAAGIAIVSGRNSQAPFMAFEDSDKTPIIDFVGAMDAETVQIDFQQNLRPSNPIEVTISGADSGAALAVKSVRFVESGKSLEVKTAPMASSTRYRATVRNAMNYAGVKSKADLFKYFKSINIRAVQKAAVASGADLNGDGKVDFIDFTMFSAVYGQSLSSQTPAANPNPSQGLSPITPTPDATVPITSEPGA